MDEQGAVPWHEIRRIVHSRDNIQDHCARCMDYSRVDVGQGVWSAVDIESVDTEAVEASPLWLSPVALDEQHDNADVDAEVLNVLWN